METNWQKLEEQFPETVGFYWIYMPSLKVGRGVLLSFYESHAFYDEGMNEWDQTLISHWCKANRPEPPIPSKKK